MDAQEATSINDLLRGCGILRSKRTWDTISSNDCRHKWFLLRTCGQHYAYRTRAAVSRHPATLECPMCDRDRTSITNKRGRARVVSPDEEKLWEMGLGEGVVWSLQDRVPNWKGAVDVCVCFPLQQWLCIQVDGITHMRKPMSDRKDQLLKDARFNEIAMEGGYSVLRLDAYHHVESWQAALNKALAHCKSHGQPPTLFESQP